MQRREQHLHGLGEGVHAALALQGFTGLLQICDCGCRCYVCIASPGRAVKQGSAPRLVTAMQHHAGCIEAAIVIGGRLWRSNSRHANSLPLEALLSLQSCAPKHTSELLLQGAPPPSTLASQKETATSTSQGLSTYTLISPSTA